MLRHLVLLLVAIVYASCAPLSGDDNRPLIRIKRATEQIVFGNHQNLPRLKKSDPAVQPGDHEDQESTLDIRVVPVESVDAAEDEDEPAKLTELNTNEGASRMEGEMLAAPQSKGEEDAPEPVNEEKDDEVVGDVKEEAEEEEVPHVEDPVEEEQVNEEENALTGLANENDLAKLNEFVPASTQDEIDNGIKEFDEDLSNIILGPDGRFSPEMYEYLRKYALRSNAYNPYTSRIYMPSNEAMAAYNNNDNGDNKVVENNEGVHHRRERSVGKPAFTAEDMMGAGAKISQKDRRKRALNEDFRYPGNVYGDGDGYYYDDEPVEERGYGPFEDAEIPYAPISDDDVIEEQIEDILRDEYARKPVLYPYEQEEEDEYEERRKLMEEETKEIRERMAIMDAIYNGDNEEDLYDQRYMETPEPYQMAPYEEEQDNYIPQKRQFLSFVPGNRKRSQDFYPYGTADRWDAMVSEELEKRSQEIMYERLLKLASLLRSPEIDEEWRKK